MLFLPLELKIKIFKNIYYFSPILRLVCKDFKVIIDIFYKKYIYKKSIKKIENFLIKVYPAAIDEQYLVDKISEVSNYVFLLNSFAETSLSERLFFYNGGGVNDLEREYIVNWSYKLIKRYEDFIDGRRKYVGDRDMNLNNRLDSSLLIIMYFGLSEMVKRFIPPTWINQNFTINDEINV